MTCFSVTFASRASIACCAAVKCFSNVSSIFAPTGHLGFGRALDGEYLTIRLDRPIDVKQCDFRRTPGRDAPATPCCVTTSPARRSIPVTLRIITGLTPTLPAIHSEVLSACSSVPKRERMCTAMANLFATRNLAHPSAVSITLTSRSFVKSNSENLETEKAGEIIEEPSYQEDRNEFA